MPLVILRVLAVLALVLLLWNPASSRTLPSGDQPIVSKFDPTAPLSIQGIFAVPRAPAGDVAAAT